MIKKRLLSRISIICLGLLFIVSLTVSCVKHNNIMGPANDTNDLLGSGPSPGNEFDLDTAVEMMRLSLQAYQMFIDFKDGNKFTLPAPYTLITQLLIGERFSDSPLSEPVPIAFIATANNNIYLVFRGTKTIDEWISDADFRMVPYPIGNTDAMTQKGFTDLYEPLGVTEAINTLAQMGSFDNIFVTGHSLGAALAVLAIPDIIENTEFKHPIMYSFAGPRVGDANFKDVYDGYGIESWRVFNINDEAPKLPPTRLGYVHVNPGKEITFGKPVSGPFDFRQIARNHNHCTYYNTLCDMTDDPVSCMNMADGADGCNKDSQ